MKRILKKRWLRWTLAILLVGGGVYEGDRLYNQANDGFRMAHIRYEHPNDPRWDVRSLTDDERFDIRAILQQPFSYLGKGGQAYAFVSQDGQYVLKFFKYRHVRTRPWIDAMAFIPAVDVYRQKRIARKQKQLESAYGSWKLAFDELQEETGLVYVHLNRTDGWLPTVQLIDKLGFSHQVDLDEVEFLMQRRVDMLEPSLEQMIERGQLGSAQRLIDRVLALLQRDYERGYSDRDPCMMRNTGVCQGKPLHVDVGQIGRHEPVTDQEILAKKLFTKTTELREWLTVHSSELAQYLDEKLADSQLFAPDAQHQMEISGHRPAIGSRQLWDGSGLSPADEGVRPSQP